MARQNSATLPLCHSATLPLCHCDISPLCVKFFFGLILSALYEFNVFYSQTINLRTLRIKIDLVGSMVNSGLDTAFPPLIESCI